VIHGDETRVLLAGATVLLTLSGCATLTVVPPERLAD
jgi:hypothetical protein